MDLRNQIVIHKKYGKGTIIEHSDNRLLIKFGTENSIRFIYPDSFEDNLVAKDSTIQSYIIQEIQKNKELDLNKKAEKNLENTEFISHNKKTSRRNLEQSFGDDYHVQFLSRSPVLSYQQVEKKFGINIRGFGRGINVTDNSIVLISSIGSKNGFFVYHDHWTNDGDYIYSGEGRNGNQKITKGNNAIINSNINCKKIYLFVKFSSQEYYYQGEFQLIDYKYEDDEDENGNIRKEFKFRLRKLSL